MENVKNNKRFSFPSAFTVLFIVLLIATVLTWVVPAGKYSTLTFDTTSSKFTITDSNGDTSEVDGTQAELDKLNVRIKFESFANEDITKPIAIPGTYKKLDQNPQGPIDFFKAPVEGIMDSIDIIVFVLILGGCIGVLNATGTFDAGIEALTKKIKGKEFLLVTLLFILIVAGGTTFGLAEETIAFYPILMPVFLASGYDALVAIATIWMGSCIGCMFSTTNPFSVVVASNAAGITFDKAVSFRFFALIGATIITLVYIYYYCKKIKIDPSKSIIADQMPDIKAKFLNSNKSETTDFSIRKKLMLILFLVGFPIMITGVSKHDWWFTEMTALFLFIGILLIVISGVGEKKGVTAFIEGAGSLISTSLIIGVARGINVIMDKGLISDSLLNYTANSVQGMNGILFVVVLFFLFALLGLFIPSSSALGTLSMPIVAPLADAVGLGREVVVTAYNYGQGWTLFITPTGLILATLEMAGVTYDRWLKFIMPLMGMIGAYAIAALALHTII